MKSGLWLWGIVGAVVAAGAHAATELDPTFAGGGTRTLEYTVTSKATLDNGRMLFGGEFAATSKFGKGANIRIARLLPDGTTDSSFSQAPYPAGSPFSVGGSAGGRLAVQGDGKIIVGGALASGSAYTIFTLGRYLPDGAVDATFGNGGSLWLTGDGEVRSVAVQPDGKILAGSNPLRRFSDAGAADAGFGSGGVVAIAAPLVRVVPLSDGRIVVAAGICGQSFPFACSGLVARLHADGSPDTTFNGTGTAQLPGYAPVEMVVLPDGRVVVAANTITGPSNSYAGRLMRLTSDGAADSAFGRGGSVEMVNPGGIADMTVEPDGNIVALGAGLQVMRWLADGTPQGRVWPILPAYTPLALLRQADGKLVVGGGELYWNDFISYSVRTHLFRYGAGTMDLFADARLFAGQQFRDFLEREGDAGGVGYWAGQLDSGAVSRAQLVMNYVESPEFQGSFAPIVRLYLAYFLRTPDYGGLQYWIDRYRAGLSLEGMSQAFQGSPEFQQRYGNLDSVSFVNLVYNNVLGRNADGGGLTHWTNKLDSGAMTRGQVMLAFSESAEYLPLSHNEVFVTMMYVGMLRRGTDSSGFMFWVGQLDQGVSGLGLIQQFLDSPEYRNRFLP